MYKKLLLPTDGSEFAKKAGKHAIYLANFSNADIIVLNVIDTNYLKSLPQPDLEMSLEKELKEDGNKAVNSFRQSLEISQCNGQCKTVNLTTEIREGKPADEIIKTINEEGIDLVVIGASGKHGFNKFLTGSVTERVVRSAKCSVLVVK